jgi:hypothetical protein
MATTTPNFGWPVPTSTDLVKDGATAIEALGDSIDASLLDLKGGTTGQVLSKNSNTDMDFTWVTDAAGDITGVTAGTGISGGGTSGTVTVTNSMATAIDAKGDLVAGTGADAFARLGVGTNGQVLAADSTESTGLKWITPAATTPTAAAVQVNKSGNQSLSNSTVTIATFDTETVDTNGFHSTVTNTDRLTVPTGYAGKYLVVATANFAGNGTGIRQLLLYKNTTQIAENVISTNSFSGSTNANAQIIVDLAVGDYMSMSVWQNSGGALNLQGSAAGVYSQFGMTYLGA